MPIRRPISREERLVRREELANEAAAGRLALPGAIRADPNQGNPIGNGAGQSNPGNSHEDRRSVRVHLGLCSAEPGRRDR